MPNPSRDKDLHVTSPPILDNKHHAAASDFTPEALLREARRQKGIVAGDVPSIFVLDPDGDLVRHLVRRDEATLDERWACYHTSLYRTIIGARDVGLVGCAVGAPFAVLVAEELFAARCRLLISITSSGQLTTLREPPYFILIEKALRDEGTSYHYVPAAEFSFGDANLLTLLKDAFHDLRAPVERGATWTTDAPFRETAEAIAAMSAKGLLAVEMEAAALYAFALARGKPVVCFAHVTNRMGRVEEDFEKGENGGAVDALSVVERTVRTLDGIS
jgi:uridine phosphorylase